jgi:hypothetical protein
MFSTALATSDTKSMPERTTDTALSQGHPQKPSASTGAPSSVRDPSCVGDVVSIA